MLEKFHYAVAAPSEGSDAWKVAAKKAKAIMRDEYIGLAATVIGTVIWGYGDLLGKLFI